MSLTHEWFAGVDGVGRWYIHGGQPDDNGHHPILIQVLEADDGLGQVTEQIAAALRGEA